MCSTRTDWSPAARPPATSTRINRLRSPLRELLPARLRALRRRWDPARTGTTPPPRSRGEGFLTPSSTSRLRTWTKACWKERCRHSGSAATASSAASSSEASGVSGEADPRVANKRSCMSRGNFLATSASCWPAASSISVRRGSGGEGDRSTSMAMTDKAGSFADWKLWTGHASACYPPPAHGEEPRDTRVAERTPTRRHSASSSSKASPSSKSSGSRCARERSGDPRSLHDLEVGLAPAELRMPLAQREEPPEDLHLLVPGRGLLEPGDGAGRLRRYRPDSSSIQASTRSAPGSSRECSRTKAARPGRGRRRAPWRPWPRAGPSPWPPCRRERVAPSRRPAPRTPAPA